MAVETVGKCFFLTKFCLL